MARESRAKKSIKRPQPVPKVPAVKAQAAQLAIAQKAMEMRRKARQEMQTQRYRQSS